MKPQFNPRHQNDVSATAVIVRNFEFWVKNFKSFDFLQIFVLLARSSRPTCAVEKVVGRLAFANGGAILSSLNYHVGVKSPPRWSVERLRDLADCWCWCLVTTIFSWHTNDRSSSGEKTTTKPFFKKDFFCLLTTFRLFSFSSLPVPRSLLIKWIKAVWPDNGLKSWLISPENSPNCSHSSFNIIVSLLEIVQKATKIRMKVQDVDAQLVST